VPTSDDAGGETGKLGTVMACAFVTPFEALRNNSALLLVVGYEEGTVALWDARDLENDEEKEEEEEEIASKSSTEPLWRERVHGDAVTSVAADATRGGFVSAAADGGVLRFAIRPVATNDDDLSGSKNDSKIRVELLQSHGGRNNEDAFAPATAKRGVACVAVRDDGKVFAAGGWDGRTRVYETSYDSKKRKPRRLASLGFHDDVVACVAFRTAVGGKGAPHAGWLATGSRDGAVALWPIFPPKNKVADGEGDEDA
jgi:WD40 repeat protein